MPRPPFVCSDEEAFMNVRISGIGRELAKAAVCLQLLIFVGCGGGGSSSKQVTAPPAQPLPTPTTYSNPLAAKVGSATVESCADPSLIRAESDGAWYMYCTGDPLNDTDKNTDGSWKFRHMPILKSTDLVTWTYVGDVFSTKPSWVKGGLWAPAIKYFGGKYYLYYSASDTFIGSGGSAIGVAVSSSPTGPWVDSGTPVVEPGPTAVIDPEVIEENGQKYIYFGTFHGGIRIRTLSADGLQSNPASEQPIAIPNRYEGPYIIRRDGYYYMFLSASNCCNGALSGYSVFVARSASPFGPFTDRDGNSVLASRTGGTLVLGMNGNRWVGPGHNAGFTDSGGKDWMVYHAIDRNRPYFAGSPGFTKRPVMMDPIDWVDGWPVVRGGHWASDTVMPKPASKTGETTQYQMNARVNDQLGQLNSAYSDDFDLPVAGAQWSWVRAPQAAAVRMNGSGLEFDTSGTELFEDIDDAPVLLEGTPSGDYAVETKLRLNVPADGCCQNYAQAGLVIYGDDDNYIKLVHASIWETRQIEFGKEVAPVPQGHSRYGSMVLEAPGDWIWLRIVKRTSGSEETYTAYTSRDGANWSRGGTWTHSLGTRARIGLLSMNAPGFTATFDYVRVYALAN